MTKQNKNKNKKLTVLVLEHQIDLRHRDTQERTQHTRRTGEVHRVPSSA